MNGKLTRGVVLLLLMGAGLCGGAEGCSRTHVVKSGDTCFAIWEKNGLNAESFAGINPGLDCNSLRVGDVVCIEENDPQCPKFHVIEKGDTCFKVWTDNKMTEEDFYAINPGIKCDRLQIGSSVCLAQNTSTSEGGENGCRKFQVVQQGDTCFNIWTDSKMMEEEFYAINPGIDCDALEIGISVCLARKTLTPGRGDSDECLKFQIVQQGDTCFAIWKDNDMGEEEFYALNPGMDCDFLEIGSSVCLAQKTPKPEEGENECLKLQVIQKGDTCFKVWTDNKMTEQEFYAINPGIDCESLEIGSSVCLAQKTSTPKEVTSEDECPTFHVIKDGDICYNIWRENGLTEEEFYAINPGIDCDSLEIGSSVCLARKASTPKEVTSEDECPTFHVIKQGDICYNIWTENGLTEEEFYAINRGIDCDTLEIGSSVCIGNTAVGREDSLEERDQDFVVPLSEIVSLQSEDGRQPTDCFRPVQIQTGDTCVAVWTQNGITSQEFYKVNPGIDCANLRVGDSVCLPDTKCEKTISVVEGDTCFGIWRSEGIGRTAFMELNPSINCDALAVGQTVCIENGSNFRQLFSYSLVLGLLLAVLFGF